MKIDLIKVGDFKANCYLVTKNNKTIIIDPGDEAKKIIDLCKDKNIVGILVTHHHFDHVGALKEISNEYKLDYNQFPIKGFDFEILKTPGHSEDSLSFYFKEEKIIFTGDFVFYHTIGRCDLIGSDFKKMKKSIKMLLTYPKDIKIYPGHGNSTILQEEISYLEEYL